MSRLPRTALALPIVFGFALQSCADREPEPAKDTVPVVETPRARRDRLMTTSSTWDTAAGHMFAVPGDTPGRAYLIIPAYSATDALDTLHVDTGSVVGTEIELLTGRDSATVARIQSMPADTLSACPVWPEVRLATGPDATDWRVAFPRNRVQTIAFDSLPSLSPRDSGQLTIAIARAASRVEGDTASVFAGRPYVVRQALRFRVADNREAVLAEVTRTVTQEANPLQEQLLLVVERDLTDTLPPETLWSERDIGFEEELESTDLVAVLRVLRSGSIALLLRRELADGASFVLLERSARGTWRLRWRSAFAGC